ncbi:hypothetical protein BCD67_12830 [Oscillatoriales cyanobacterium USR001]|nr:hypothetical protein BCD67_12830 [Oscillatoriales cyanobacterium USR001]
MMTQALVKTEINLESKNETIHGKVWGQKTEEIKFRHSRFNGLVLLPYMTEERMNLLAEFPTRDGDVYVVTYMKSATTWLAQIIREIAKPTMPEGLTEEDVLGGTVPCLEAANFQHLAAYPSPRHMVTHLPYSLTPKNSQQNLKYIYNARNPRDVAVSMFHYMRVLEKLDWDGTWDEFLGYFMKGDVPYGSYFDHVLEWWAHRNDENVLFLKYEDLKKAPVEYITKIAEFLGYSLSRQEAERVSEECSFSAMKANKNTNYDRYRHQIYKKESDFNFMRKGIVGDWQNHFSHEQLAEFNQLYASRMNGTGLDFEFTIQ